MKNLNNFATTTATHVPPPQIDAPHLKTYLWSVGSGVGCQGDRWYRLLSNMYFPNKKFFDLRGTTAHRVRMLRKLTERHWIELGTLYDLGYRHHSSGVCPFVRKFRNVLLKLVLLGTLGGLEARVLQLRPCSAAQTMRHHRFHSCVHRHVG